MDHGDKLFPAKSTNLFPDLLPEVDEEYIVDPQFLSPSDSRWLIVLAIENYNLAQLYIRILQRPSSIFFLKNVF